MGLKVVEDFEKQSNVHWLRPCNSVPVLVPILRIEPKLTEEDVRKKLEGEDQMTR